MELIRGITMSRKALLPTWGAVWGEDGKSNSGLEADTYLVKGGAREVERELSQKRFRCSPLGRGRRQ